MRTSTLIPIAAALAGAVAACDKRPELDEQADLPPPRETTFQVLKRFVPEVPEAACGTFKWKRMEDQTEDARWVQWTLEEKHNTERRHPAITFNLADLTDILDEPLNPPTTTFAGFPAWRSSGFLEVKAGNVYIAIWVGSSFRTFATDAVLDKLLSDVDLQALSKL